MIRLLWIFAKFLIKRIIFVLILWVDITQKWDQEIVIAFLISLSGKNSPSTWDFRALVQINWTVGA